MMLERLRKVVLGKVLNNWAGLVTKTKEPLVIKIAVWEYISL